jgi:hypothetical protein
MNNSQIGEGSVVSPSTRADFAAPVDQHGGRGSSISVTRLTIGACACTNPDTVLPAG